MKKNLTLSFPILLSTLILTSCNTKSNQANETTATADSSSIHFAQEKHLKNVKQLTFGGENAEAYWSFDDSKLTYQAKNAKQGLMCDQIFLMNPTDTSKKLISTGK